MAGTEQPSANGAPAPASAAQTANDSASAGGPGAGGEDAGPSSSSDQSAAVLAYLNQRGFQRAAAALKTELEATAQGASPAAAAAAGAASASITQAVSLADLAAKTAPREGKEKEREREGTASGVNQSALPEPTGEAATAQALLLDPTDRARGFGMLKAWCEGSLDIYQPELRPMLLPIFVHSYLDLVEMGYGNAASAFYSAHAASFLPTHTSLLSQIRALALPSHVASDSLAQRFRSERYVLKMSQTVFGLLLGWLTDGTGPVAGGGAADGVGLEGPEAPARRGREAMLKIVNERCRIQVLRMTSYQLDGAVLEEGTGLTGAGPSFSSTPAGSVQRSRQHPALHAAAVSENDALAEFNARAAGPQLKLGPRIPLPEKLQNEVDRELRDEERRERERERAAKEAASAAAGEQAGEGGKEGQPEGANGEAMQGVEATGGPANASKGAKEEGKEGTPAPRSARTPTPAPDARASDAPVTTSEDGANGKLSSGLLAPTLEDLPPQPPSFRTVDVWREVERVRDARKRIRLDPALASGGSGFLTGVRDAMVNGMGEEGAKAARAAALPSVCAYTYHDAEDGLTCSQFSEDISLMAAGFEESYVQLWSLKGESLRGLRSDFSLSSVRDSKSLRKQREREGTSTRKLIGHSGPVYSISFDPVAGSAGPPRHLLSASADGTARLWSLETFNALVAYRGHQHPVWDVEWGPLGTYFATASADRTARLWSSERINPLRIYAGHLSDVDCLRFHPNSLYLATGSSDRTCRLWDVQRGACVRLFVGHQSPVSCVRISPDGRYLASAGAGDGHGFSSPTNPNAGDDTAISIWDLASGRRIKKMWGHTARVHSLDFSADGALLVSGGADCTVRCWDVRGAGGARRTPAQGSLEAQQLAAASAEDSASGAAPTAGGEGGAIPLARSGQTAVAPPLVPSADCVTTFFTKKTPVVDVHFTPRNLCLVAGAFDTTL